MLIANPQLKPTNASLKVRHCNKSSFKLHVINFIFFLGHFEFNVINQKFHTHSAFSSSPFNQLYHYEVIAISPVVENKAVGGSCLELHEEMHGVVGLQCGQRDEAGARAEGDGVRHNAFVAYNGIELAVVDVAVLAQVDIGHAVQRQALEVADEIGGHSRHEALLCHNARLHVVELQLGVVTCHLTWWRG